MVYERIEAERTSVAQTMYVRFAWSTTITLELAGRTRPNFAPPNTTG
jgi:hypothetical protein